MSSKHNLLLLAGDGIGPEVIAQAEKVLVALGSSVSVATTYALLGGAAIDTTGIPLPDATKESVSQADAVLLGAIGGPKWNKLPHEKKPESGLLALREMMQVYANIRPAKIFPQLLSASSLREELVQSLDMIIVRELTGGIYFGQPRGIEMRQGQKVGFNTEVYSQQEISRITHMACKIAQGRNNKLCLVDKANVLESSMLWREVVQEIAQEYQDMTLDMFYVDNAAMQLVKDPCQFDVVVTNNIFGDILSDLAAQIVGSIGLLASASLGDGHVGLYEPIHGSAPDIAGMNKANPLATILSLAMCFRYSFHNHTIANLLEQAVERTLNAGWRTVDIATVDTQSTHVLSTSEMGDCVCDELFSLLN